MLRAADPINDVSHVVRCTADKLRFTLVEPSLAMHSSEPT
jgi:hypothetical protein